MDPYEKVILLVEDEALIAMVEKEELEAYGYTVITANSGQRAVDLATGPRGAEIDPDTECPECTITESTEIPPVLPCAWSIMGG